MIRLVPAINKRLRIVQGFELRVGKGFMVVKSSGEDVLVEILRFVIGDSALATKVAERGELRGSRASVSSQGPRIVDGFAERGGCRWIVKALGPLC